MKTAAFLSVFLLGSVLLSFGQSTSIVPVIKSIKTEVPEHIRNSNQFKRAEWFNSQRAFPSDTIPLTTYFKVVDQELLKEKSGRLKSDDFPQWTSLGPRGIESTSAWGRISGRVRVIAVHPTDPQTLYIGAASGGLWKSADGGANWSDFGYGLESQTFGAIAIDPKNPEVVYAGSGECSYLTAIINFSGRGLYKSLDGGRSWILITNGIGTQTHFADLGVSPYNSSLVLGAMASGDMYLSSSLPNEGIWRSADAGLTWSRTLEADDAFDIEFHPTDANKIYAAIGGGNSNSGFYISNDQGLTWIKSNDGLDPTKIHRIQIDISKSNPDFIYAVTYDLNGSSELGITSAWKSINGGTSWTRISAGTKLGGFDGSSWYDQGFYDLCIAVDPVNPDHVLIGNVELHRTTNGSTFAPVRPYGSDGFGSLVHCDYHQLVYAPSNPNILYIGCDGGVFRSEDKGYTAASKNKGLKTLQFYRIASHPSNPGIFMGGMQDNSSAITVDGGRTWNSILSGDGMECFFDPADFAEFYYGSWQNGVLLKGIIGGTGSTVIYNAKGAWITPFFMHPADNRILYTANTKILKSTNAGQTFGVISGPSDVAPANISTMAQNQVNPDIMIFATGLTKWPQMGSVIVVKISTDGGATWADVTANIPGETRWISRVVTDPVDANTFYVLKTGFSPGNKIYKTNDLGQTWSNISGDLPDLPCSDLFIDPENTRQMFLANDIGVYWSTDGGVSWEYASEGMSVVPAIDFDYVKIDSVRYLRVGTFGRSAYQTELGSGTGMDLTEATRSSTTFGLVSSYPNPLNSIISIEYELLKPGKVELVICNELGQQIKTLFEGYQSVGSQKVTCDLSTLSVGIYYFRLRSGNDVVTRKLVAAK
ncbi:MAG: T9SS type A sorting domain-containing protein [Bacteroidia bacterium]|nr:T9SS type A sorting domain-containing protein [Bacteroidia bacterium]